MNDDIIHMYSLRHYPLYDKIRVTESRYMRPNPILLPLSWAISGGLVDFVDYTSLDDSIISNLSMLCCQLLTIQELKLSAH